MTPTAKYITHNKRIQKENNVAIGTYMIDGLGHYMCSGFALILTMAADPHSEDASNPDEASVVDCSNVIFWLDLIIAL